MKDKSRLLPKKPTSPTEIFANENYPNKPSDTECKRTIINFVK